MHDGLALNVVDNWQNCHLYPDHLHSGACALASSACKHLQAGAQQIKMIKRMDLRRLFIYKTYILPAKFNKNLSLAHTV